MLKVFLSGVVCVSLLFVFMTFISNTYYSSKLKNTKNKDNDIDTELDVCGIDIENSTLLFGKHKGKTWSQVPDSYLYWMIEEDHKFTSIAKALVISRELSKQTENTSAA